MRPAAHMQAGKVNSNNTAESASCHTGTPKGMRNIIATGEVNGISESHTDNEPEGASIMAGSINMAIISGAVTGMVNCCESDSLSTNDPMAANSEAYSK